MSYRVRLSHARGDEKTAQWLLRRVNAFRTPPSLAETEGAQGPVPARLNLELCTRADDAAGPEQDANALQDAQALIVLCSPLTAADPWVNREIDAFVTLGRLRRILPVIAPDAPETDDFERDFYPPALCGRGLFKVDLRDIRVDDELTGDGREGGLLKLLSALIGVEVHRLAQDERRRQGLRLAAAAVATIVFAASAITAGAFGVLMQRRALTAEARWQAASQEAEEAAQLRDAAIAAGEMSAAQRAQVEAELQRAKGSLRDAVRDLGGMSDAVVNQINASTTADPASVQTLRAVEQTYWRFADLAPYFEFRPASIIPAIEKISLAYAHIGQTEDATRVTTRLAQLNRRIARDRTASPAWRSTYASSLVTLAGERAARGDRAGQMAAFSQATQILEPICADAPAPQQGDVHANACLRFAAVSLSRARVQSEAGQSVDAAPLERGRALLAAAIADYPNNARIQSAAPRLRDQLAEAAVRQPSAPVGAPQPTND